MFRTSKKFLIVVIIAVIFSACEDNNPPEGVHYIVAMGSRFEPNYTLLAGNGFKYALGDANGKPISKFKYDRISYYGGGLFRVQIFVYEGEKYISSKFGLMDSTGKEITEIKYDFIEEYFSKEDFVAACIGYTIGLMSDWKVKWGYLNRMGEEVVETKYDKICSFSSINIGNFFILPILAPNYQGPYNEEAFFCYGLTYVMLDGKFGFIDTTGKVIVPIIYDWVSIFLEELAAVYLDGKWGFVDTTGEVAIPIIYEKAGSFNNGRAMVVLDDEIFYINKQGERI